MAGKGGWRWKRREYINPRLHANRRNRVFVGVFIILPNLNAFSRFAPPSAGRWHGGGQCPGYSLTFFAAVRSRDGFSPVWSILLNEPKRRKVRLRTLPPILLSLFLMTCSSAQAKPKFNASEVAGPGQQLMICDLDGDGLKDLVLMDDTNLAIFYQNPQRGFTREPQQIYHLEPRPCLVWTAKLGGPAGSLLVMTSDGVTELCFHQSNRPADRSANHSATHHRSRMRRKARTRCTFHCRSKPAATGRCCWCRQRTGFRFGSIGTSGVRRKSSAMLWRPACGRH